MSPVLALGLVFAALALLDNPTVLKAFQQPTPKIFGIVTVIAYLLAVACGFFAALPMRNSYRRNVIGAMQVSLEQTYRSKYILVITGSACFVLGTAALGGLVIAAFLAI